MVGIELLVLLVLVEDGPEKLGFGSMAIDMCLRYAVGWPLEEKTDNGDASAFGKN